MTGGMDFPRLLIDVEKLTDNVRHVVDVCRKQGIEVMGVVKASCAHPAVARAFVEGGVWGLGDSRLENLDGLDWLGGRVSRTLLRLPGLSQVDWVVRAADYSLNSEPEVLGALGRAAGRAGVKHGVFLMVDVGDLREGALAREMTLVARAAREQPALEVVGVGTNLACYGGVKPSPENMHKLLRVHEQVAEVLGYRPGWISGGNSANWQLLRAGGMPEGINNLRIGEAILLGNETIEKNRIEGCHPDVFSVQAEVIESRRKPSVPIGEVGLDAFGRKPTFEDRGSHHRAIVALGRQDVVPEGLSPVMEGVKIIGASSDHTIVDVEDAPRGVGVGDVLTFTVRSYSALLALFTSKYVRKRVMKRSE